MATATTTKTKTKATKKTKAKKATKKRATPKKNLVIVESPAKAKTIEKYLGRNYKVVASVGHIRDLKKSSMSIDFENNYEPQYINIRGKGPLIKELKKEAKKAKKVFLASDPDREGEAISWHLSHILGLDPEDKNRVVFNEITKDAVKNAFAEPRAIDMDLVDAQQARRVLDRIVGYSISPLLWKKVKKGLSAGRVQSVALKLIIDRENEIKAFKPEEYWTIDGAFKKGAKKFQASFYGLDGKKLKLNNNDDVKDVLSRIISDDFNVDKVERKERRRNAPLPYTTAKKAKKVFLASDPDREGEAISWHLSHILGLDPEDKNRVVFNEITKDAVKNAFAEPRAIDMDLVDAQQARRVLDRIVGYSISPLLWKKVKKGLSAGRVQSVALKLIIDRENEIKAFKPEEYWTIDGAFKKGAKKFQASFYGLDGKKLKLNNNDDVKDVLSRIISDDFNVDKVERKERRRNAPLPYTTSSLQQDAANKINFRTRKTMMVAQQLYEGINLGSGAQGLITYMRTDSTRISPVAQNQAAEFITEHFGSKYSKHGSKVKNSSAAQDAHEAIRPSNVFQTPESIAKYLDKDQLKLYTLIWNRFVASQMTAAVFDTMKVTLSQNGVIFTANGSQIKFDGYMAVYNDSDKNKMLPEMAEGDTIKKVVTTPEQHFTQPPARYSEATLIKTLEENGVGRPSTYAPTLDVIQRRYYVKLVAKRFEPTELGEIVNSLIVEFFPDIVDVKFTAEMEAKLDKVEIGKEQWQKVIDEFFKPFQKELEKAEEGIEKIQIKDEPAGFDCDLCGHPMVIKLGRYGKFYACSNFPDCHNTKAITKEIGVTCPTCGQGQVIERKTKRNRVFYGCDRYPDCEFTSWDIPIGRNCPKSGDYLVEKKVRGGGKQVICSNEECDYKESVVK